MKACWQTFSSWQPGKGVSREPDGLPWLLETNTDLVLQLHLKPTGKPEEIQSSVGFYFTDQPPTNTPIINPDDSLAQDCLNELLKAKAVRKQRN